MSDHSLLMGLHKEIDQLVLVLETECFDPKVPQEATRDARIRRLQLIDVRDYLLGKSATL